MMRTILAQASPALGDKDKNIGFIEDAVGRADADLAVFGEMFLTGYMCRDRIPKLAEKLDGNSVKRISRISAEYGTHIIFGMPERSDTRRGIVHNSAVLACPDGKISAYRKLYLANFGPFEEKQHFAPGSGAPVFDTKIGKIGMLVCFDLFFPELAKTYTMKGADIIACISASPSSTKPFFEKVIVARAIENTTFVLYSNLVGTELGMVFWGGCHAVGPRGDIIAKGTPFKEEIVKADIDLKELDVARQLRPTIKDTRADVIDELRRSV